MDDKPLDWRDLLRNSTNTNKPVTVYSVRYSLPKADIQAFVNDLAAIMDAGIEQALEDSGYAEANQVLKQFRLQK